MRDYQTIKIEGVEYFIIGSMQDFRAEDSFIHNDNKLARFNGNGESKKHVGTYKGTKGKSNSIFFNYSKWGLDHSDPNKNNWKTFNSAKSVGAIISENRCFFSKTNLLKYLKDAETEYYSQEQNYHDNISEYYTNRLNELETLNSNHIYFSIYDASDSISKKQNRGYIRSDDKIWSIWRKLILPGISYLSILKLVPTSSVKSEPLFYFRILLDYKFRSFVHPISLEKENENDTFKKENKNQKIKKRAHDFDGPGHRSNLRSSTPTLPSARGASRVHRPMQPEQEEEEQMEKEINKRKNTRKTDTRRLTRATNAILRRTLKNTHKRRIDREFEVPAVLCMLVKF
jgi:predicted restriction endonuclease